MSKQRANSLKTTDALNKAASVTRVSRNSSSHVWLLVTIDKNARIRNWQVSTPSIANEAIETALAELVAQPQWLLTEGGEGPWSGIDGLVWRAQWASLTAEHSLPNTAKTANPTKPDGKDGTVIQRILHLEAEDLMSNDVTRWLDRCPDIVIGRDESGNVRFVNNRGAALSDPSLLETISAMPAITDGSDYHLDEIQVSGEKPRFFQRTLIPAPSDVSLEDFVIAQEITARKEVEHALGDNEHLMRILIDATPDFIAVKDGDGRWLLANDAGLRLYHLHGQPWWGKAGTELADLTDPIYAESFRHCSASDEMAWTQRAQSRSVEKIPLPQGKILTFDVLKLPVFNPDGQRKVLIVIGRDVTERQEAENLYRRLANHDELTGLFNRRHFQEEADRRISAEPQQQGHALVLMDLDQFKAINDRCSHDKGDWLLARVAERLDRFRNRYPDILTARMGGDEFALLIPLKDDEEANENLQFLETYLQTIAHEIRQPFLMGGQSVVITASFGVARAPQDGNRILTLLKAAESAVYEAKSSGRDSQAYFSQEIAEKQAWRGDMLNALRSGLNEERFRLHYQVQQNARSLAITGVEALLRWSPPTEQLTAGPDRFIPLLEESGLIIEVGNWVLQTACQQAALWGKQLGERITMAVNVSSLQLHAEGFVEQVEAALQASGIEPAQLELELTESALVIDPDRASATLKALKAIGVKLSLDDFGTGYSSLSYLTSFSFDRLKIDKSFVSDLMTDPNDLEVVKAIIAMGHALGLDVIAEGVERIIERDMLESLGCDYFQGYLVGRPGAPEQISHLLGVGLL